MRPPAALYCVALATAATVAEGAPPAASQDGDKKRPSASIVIEETPGPAEAPPAPAGDEKLKIGDAIRRNSPQVETCYSEALERNPLLMGKLVAHFDIGPSGKVIGAAADGVPDRELLLCVVKAVRKWDFPKPASGGKLRVRYPFRLEPRASALPASASLGTAR
jgi:outer membrane biosynthesis protein TonB